MAGCVDLAGEVEEELAISKSSCPETAAFDRTVENIQDILLDERFLGVQRDFMLKHCHHFEDVEENKFIYTDIFQQYTQLVEEHMERELQSRQPDFNMCSFLQSLEEHKGEVGEEILDLLLSFTDFIAFKQTILAYKAAKEGSSMLMDGLTVTPLPTKR